MKKYDIIIEYLKNHDVEEITDTCEHEFAEDIIKFYNVLEKAGFASDIVGAGENIDPRIESWASSLYIINTSGFMEDFNEDGNKHFPDAIDDEFDPLGGHTLITMNQ